MRDESYTQNTIEVYKAPEYWGDRKNTEHHKDASSVLEKIAKLEIEFPSINLEVTDIEESMRTGVVENGIQDSGYYEAKEDAVLAALDGMYMTSLCIDLSGNNASEINDFVSKINKLPKGKSFNVEDSMAIDIYKRNEEYSAYIILRFGKLPEKTNLDHDFTPEVLNGTVSVFRSVPVFTLDDVATYGACNTDKLERWRFDYSENVPVEELLREKARELGVNFDHSANILAHPTDDGMFLRNRFPIDNLRRTLEMRVDPDKCLVCNAEKYTQLYDAVIYNRFNPHTCAETYWKDSMTLTEFLEASEKGEIYDPTVYEVLIPYRVPPENIRFCSKVHKRIY